MSDKLKDAIYGFAVADALGVPFEFKERGTFTCETMTGHGTWNQPPGTWSDDTSMTLATCKSIKDKDHIDIEDIRNNFRLWLFEDKFTANGNTFDVGNTTREALINNEGLSDYYSNGNGSLMRILPLAFINVSEDEINEVSGITHNHKISKEACRIYINIAKDLLNNKSLNEILLNLELGKDFTRLKILNTLEEKEIKSSGFVIDTLEASLWCNLKSNSYKEAVLRAVNLGGDTDTIAAITGGLAGIIYGFKAIPKEWLAILKNKSLIDMCLF